MMPESGRQSGLIGMGLTILILANAIIAHEGQAVEGQLTNLRPEIGFLKHEYNPNRIQRSLSGQRDCTATLVTPDFVLTAAHCVDFSPDNPEEYSFFIYHSKHLA
jgi:Trypsin